MADATGSMRRRTTKRAARSEREETVDGAVVPKRNVTDSLTAALGCEIIAGLYPPGSRLPNEASLLVRFGVSRPTLREAFRALEAKGLIVSRQKVGTMVRPKADWHMLDADFLAWHMQAAPTEVFVSDVLQLRRIFEPQAAALAAESRDEASLARIEAAYADMEAHKSGDAELIAADVRFHKEILQASGNRLLGALGSLIEMALVGTFKMGWRSLAIKDDRLHQHRDVMQAIAARRPEAARASPAVSSARRRAREAAVSAVSAPAKNAAAMRAAMIQTTEREAGMAAFYHRGGAGG